MHTKILKWKKPTTDRQAIIDELDAMRREMALQEQEKRKAEKIDRYIQLLPMRFRDKTFANYDVENAGQARAKKIAERFVTTFDERMIAGTPVKLMGKSGTGKTMLSLIMYQELAKSGYSVKYESSLEFLKGLLEIKFHSQSSFNSYLDALRNIQFLIIDEVTESVNKSGIPSEIEKQLLFKILNDRYENKLCTMVITNRDDAEFIARLGVPITDRFSEGGITLAFNWESYRKK